MADIAILVAEEYERRVKRSRESGEEIELLSCVGLLGQSLSVVGPFSSVKGKMNVGLLGKRALEPKSQMSLAATNGFFSA